ncbi:hypothetical protein BKA57DRAFT_525370 [Linnemannia elongata]|nr:hypothetical protein BKA57DRAFT_525370 [Linnemannia elongata]
MPVSHEKSLQQDVVAEFVDDHHLEYCMLVYLDAFLDAHRANHPDLVDRWDPNAIYDMLEQVYKGIRLELLSHGLLTDKAAAGYSSPNPQLLQQAPLRESAYCQFPALYSYQQLSILPALFPDIMATRRLSDSPSPLSSSSSSRGPKRIKRPPSFLADQAAQDSSQSIITACDPMFCDAANILFVGGIQAAPDIEHNLHQFRDQRLKARENSLFVPPQAKPTFQSSDEALVPLMEMIHKCPTEDGLLALS